MTPEAEQHDIECLQISMGHGKVDVGPIHWEGRSGIILHPREDVIPVGQPGTLAGSYWPVAGDVVIWIDKPEGAAVIMAELARLCPATAAVILPGEADYRAWRATDPEHRADGTIEALATCAAMLETFGQDCFPANEHGQIHFARSMMDATAAEIRAYLASAPALAAAAK